MLISENTKNLNPLLFCQDLIPIKEKNKMAINHYKILLIEDNIVNAKLIQNLLLQSDQSSLMKNLSFDIISCQTLADAIKILSYKDFHVILLDLMLPDSNGLDSLLILKNQCPNIPIIVQTGSEDENIIVQAFHKGADGYLKKKNLDQNLLIYAIRLAIERKQYISNQEVLRKEKQREIELENLESLTDGVKTSVTARMFASEPIRESLPNIFAELVQQYSHLLDLALEERAFKIDYEISEKLRSFADKLGFLKGSPRDIIEIHTTALKNKHKEANLSKIQAYVDEGRLRVLELMGYLASYYRKYYIGLSNLNNI